MSSEDARTPLQGRLKDKRAVITGGGRGIGAAVARMLTAEGAAVVVSARSQQQVDAVAHELLDQGYQAGAVVCDVTNPDAVTRLVEESMEFLGGVDILVNNAGIATSAPLKNITLDEWNRVFAVNMTGTFLCTQGFLPGMLERGWGRVVNVASVAGKTGAAYISNYAASKHAVVGFTRSLAVEVATKGVTVNAVCPGYVATDMTEESVARIIGKTGIPEEKARGYLEELSPQKRVFEAEEIAYQVLALCDPRAAGVNGQAVVVDGGAVQS